MFAIGDSVMRGAANDLSAHGVVVVAEVNRQMKTMVRSSNSFRPTTGSARLSSSTSARTATSPTRPSKLLHRPRRRAQGRRPHQPRRPQLDPANNAKLAALPAQFPNVTVLDWATLANQCPGDCLYDDGIHLKPDGQRYYIGLITQQAGLP